MFSDRMSWLACSFFFFSSPPSHVCFASCSRGMSIGRRLTTGQGVRAFSRTVRTLTDDPTPLAVYLCRGSGLCHRRRVLSKLKQARVRMLSNQQRQLVLPLTDVPFWQPVLHFTKLFSLTTGPSPPFFFFSPPFFFSLRAIIIVSLVPESTWN